MKRNDQQDLLQVVRMRARVAKADAAAVAARRKAEFAAQLAAVYSYDDDEVWKKAQAAADVAAEAAQKDVARRCAELGIPRRFAPEIRLLWYGRGENAVASRRAELTKVANTKIEQLQKEAIHEIERSSVELQTQLVAGCLESEEAKAFLEAMPTAEQLMPQITVEQIKKQLARPARSEFIPE